MSKKNKRKAPKCECGTRMLAIAYGLPGPALFRSAERGEIYLGGCIIDWDAPTFRCPNCNRTSGRLGSLD